MPFQTFPQSPTPQTPQAADFTPEELQRLLQQLYQSGQIGHPTPSAPAGPLGIPGVTDRPVQPPLQTLPATQIPNYPYLPGDPAPIGGALPIPNTGPAVGFGNVPPTLDISASTPPPANVGSGSDPARAAAESYLGRPMSDAEYKALVNATYAEADPGSATEAAMVAASILNRAADSGKTINSVLNAPNQFQSVTGVPGNRNPSPNFVNGPDSSTRNFITSALTGILPNVSHQQTDFTSGDPRAYGPGTDLGVLKQDLAQGYSRVGGSVFNTAPPSASQTASATPSTGGENSQPSLYGGSGLLGGFSPMAPQLASYNPTSASPAFNVAFGNGAASAALAAPTDAGSGAPATQSMQTAANWLPSSLLQGGSGYQDPGASASDYKGTPAQTVNFVGGYNNTGFVPPPIGATAVPTGPYGAEALVNAAMAGDPAAIQAAMDAIQKAAVAANPGLVREVAAQKAADFFHQPSPPTPIQDAIQQQIGAYLGNVEKTAPGATRQAQAAFNNNPALYNMLSPAQQGQLKDAFASLPPVTAQMPKPNQRPDYVPPPPPLVAGNQPDPFAPKMASFDTSQLPPKDDTSLNAFPWSSAPPMPSANFGSSAYPFSGPTLSPFAPPAAAPSFGSSQQRSAPQDQFGFTSTAPTFSQARLGAGVYSPAGQALYGFGSPLPSSAFTSGLPSTAAPNPYLFGGIPKNVGFASAMPPLPNRRPQMSQPQQETVAAAPPPPTQAPMAPPPTAFVDPYGQGFTQPQAQLAALNGYPTDANGNFVSNNSTWMNADQYLPDYGGDAYASSRF